LSIYALVAKI